MCLTSQINKLESDLSKQEQYIKYLYSVIEGHEEEIEDLRKKNSKLRVQLKDALETSSFKEECIVSLEQKIDEIENKNIELKERILEYSSKVNNGVMDPRPTHDAFPLGGLTSAAVRLAQLDNRAAPMSEYQHSMKRIVDGLEELIKRSKETFDALRGEQDRANGLDRQVGVLRVEVWRIGQRYLKWKRKTHNEREAIIQHRRTIHNWLTRYNDDTEALRQRNDRNSRRARDLYQRDTTRLRREKNACIQQAQNWRGRERNAQNRINNLNQQIINLQNNPLQLQNTGMAGYPPPRFSGKADDDLDDYIKNYRLYLTAAGIATNNAAGKQRALALFQSCLTGDATHWYEAKLAGKKWRLNHVRCGNALANMSAVQALNNANITLAMINAPDGTAPPALPAGATGVTVVPIHNVHIDEDWSLAGGCPVDAATADNIPNGVLNNNNHIVLPDINISQVILVYLLKIS